MTSLSILESIMDPYLSDYYTLPWIVVGLVVTYFLGRHFGRDRVDKIMKKYGLVLLFVFIPILMFSIFINMPLGRDELIFSGVTLGVLSFMYLLAYFLGAFKAKKLGFEGMKKRIFLKSILTNQGRSAAFVGGAILAIERWRVPAGIYIAFVGVGLFAVIPFILSRMRRHEKNNMEQDVSPLPWHLRVFPWYLLSFIIIAIYLHNFQGIELATFGDGGVIIDFLASLTIPLALYYVGSSIHPTDLRLDEMKKIILPEKNKSNPDFDWAVGRNAFYVTMVYTSLIIAGVFSILLFLGIIPNSWFAVIVINSILPITSTNMWLVPYGLNPKGTALSITWTTVISIPLVLVLIPLLSTIL